MFVASDNLVMLWMDPSDAGETSFPPDPLLPMWRLESLGSNCSYGRSESGLSRDVVDW
jgi:hypothetical protein